MDTEVEIFSGVQKFASEPVKKFTLIELLAAVAVVVVVTVLAGKKS